MSECQWVFDSINLVGAAGEKALLAVDQSHLDEMKSGVQQDGWYQVQNEVHDEIENIVTSNKISSPEQVHF